MRAFQRPQPQCINFRFQCQLSHVTPSYAFLVAMCIFMLAMLVMAAEHAQLVTKDHMKPLDRQHIQLHHTTLKHIPLMLPTLNNVLPAMALQNEIVKSSIWYLSCSLSHANVRRVSFSPGFNIPSGVGRMVEGVVVVLLLLMSGDIEMNPGPVENKLTSDDLGCVLGEVLDVSADWYDLGLQLKLRIGILDNIRADFTAAKHRLREMLKTWLTTGDDPSWKTLINALRSRMVGASQLAAVLETRYCSAERTELDVGVTPETDIFSPSSVSQSLPTVMLQQTDMQESVWTSPHPDFSPIIDDPTPPESQAAAVIPHHPLPHMYIQEPLYSPELQVLKLYFNKLVVSISHPERLAFELHSQDMISAQVRDETLKIMGPSTRCRASKLIAAVKDQITMNPSALYKFLSVVRGDPSLVYIADAMSDHYRSLLPPKGADNCLPTLIQLSTELKHFENWYLLGLQLSISKNALDSIEKACNTSVRCCIEMLQHWINNSKNPSWDAFHEALRNIGESVVAEKIALKYNIKTITEEEKLPAQSSPHPSSGREETPESSTTGKVLKPRQIILREQGRVTGYFAIVMDRITEIVASSVKQDKLLQFLHFYGHPLNPEMRYIDQQILQNTSSVSEVMKSLFPDYINYINTGLLEDIIVRFECKEAEILLQQYHDRYPINRLLRDMPDPVPDKRLDLTRRKRLRAKCDDDFDGARAIDVKRIRTAIESATGIDHRFVTHAQHSEGCFILTFLIPESVIGIFQDLSDEDLEILAEARIMELQVDNFVISDIQKYCLQKTDSSTQSIIAPIAGQSGITAKGFDSYINQRAKHFTSKEKGQISGLLKSIPKSRMEEVASYSFLQQLATHVEDWRELAPHFGITEHEVEVLAFSYSDVGEQRYRALHCWKQINPDNATYKELIACLLAHAPFQLIEAALKLMTPESAVQETHKSLQEAYLLKDGQPLWTGAPELLQFDRRLVLVTEDTDEELRDIDYSSRLETLEQFSSKIETVSIKSFVNTVGKKKDRFFLIKGPPGSGRTTLLQKVCAFWAQGFCLRKFTLVLWLDLKAHPSAPSDLSLRTLLSCTLPQDNHLDTIQQWLERHGTQDILILVDGVEGQAYNEWKVFLEWLVGTKVSVVLTATSPIQITDPATPTWKAERYMKLCQYDLLGLSQDHISKQVIHYYCHDTARAEEFLMYISEAHDIRALCSSPPHLAAVLFVFDNVSSANLPNTWTQLFTSLSHTLLALSSVPDHDTLALLASKAYTVTSINSTLKWHHSYTNICTRVTSPHLTMMTAAEHCCFTVPLLQHYLCAQHIHSLPHDLHVPALNEKTDSLHVRQFYIGLCTSSERVKVIQAHTGAFMYAACVSELAVEELQDLMTSELTFTKQLLTSFDIHRIYQTVHYSGLLCKLKFHQCHFGHLTLETMAKCLRTDSILPSDGAVHELSLSDNHISDKGAHALSEALQVNQSLEDLDLSDNQVKDEGARALGEALQVNQTLLKLVLSGNLIKEEGACALSEALRVNQTLQKLDLSQNQIKGQGAHALSETLRVNQSLQKLNLSVNQIKEGACALSEALQVNQSLQELDLSGNQISDEGAHALSEALRVNRSILKLDLEWNQIKEEGARALSGALQVNHSLRELNLWNNQIKDKGAHALSVALQMNWNLQELNLSVNQISNEGACALSKTLRVNQCLQNLDLSVNQISDEGICALSHTLRVNNRLQKLDLRRNQISDVGARALSDALKVNQSLQELNVEYSQISSQGRSALREAQLKRKNLKQKNLKIKGIEWQRERNQQERPQQEGDQQLERDLERDQQERDHERDQQERDHDRDQQERDRERDPEGNRERDQERDQQDRDQQKRKHCIQM